MSASRPIRELRDKAAALLIERIKEGPEDKRTGRFSVSQISEKLGISRQAVYDIQNGKYCPSLSLIHRMCEEWDDKFDLGGIVISRTTLGRKKSSPPPIKTQGDLFEAIRQLDSRHFEVIDARPMEMGHALEITLRLTVPRRKKAS